MLLPLAQKTSAVFGRCVDKTVRIELVGGFGIEIGNTYGFDMARKGSLDCYLCRMLYRMFHHEKPFQAQLAMGVMAFPEAHE